LRCPRRLAGLAHISMSRGAQIAHLERGRAQHQLAAGRLSGTFCRNRTIDVATWRIRDNGWVDREDPFVKSTGTSTTTGSRLDLIWQSLRGN